MLSARLRHLGFMLCLPFLLMCHKSSTAPDTTTSVPTNYYLYASNSTSDDISMFQMNATTGILTSLGANVPAHTTPRDLAGGGAGPTAFLYAINTASNDISGYSVNAATGLLTSLAGSPFAAGFSAPTGVAATPNFLYVISTSTDHIYCFTINPLTGALTANGNWATGVGAASVVVDDTLSFVYVVNNASHNISGFSINQLTGALTAVPGSPFNAGVSPNGIATTGPYLHVAATASNAVASYTIDPSTGTLTAVAGSPFASNSSDVIGVYPTGQFVYVQGATNSIEGHVANISGALSAMPGSPFSMGSTGPTCGFAFDPTQHFMYAHGGDGNIYAFAIDPVTGDLTALSTPSFPSGTGAIGLNTLIMGEFPQ